MTDLGEAVAAIRARIEYAKTDPYDTGGTKYDAVVLGALEAAERRVTQGNWWLALGWIEWKKRAEAAERELEREREGNAAYRQQRDHERDAAERERAALLAMLGEVGVANG